MCIGKTAVHKWHIYKVRFGMPLLTSCVLFNDLNIPKDQLCIIMILCCIAYCSHLPLPFSVVDVVVASIQRHWTHRATELQNTNIMLHNSIELSASFLEVAWCCNQIPCHLVVQDFFSRYFYSFVIVLNEFKFDA